MAHRIDAPEKPWAQNRHQIQPKINPGNRNKSFNWKTKLKTKIKSKHKI
jgi:hypothetical protein